MISSSIFKNVFQRSGRFLISPPGSAIATPKVIRTAAQQSHAKEEIKPPNNEHLVMEILSDFAEKHGGSPSFNSELWKLLLTSARLKELGVGFNPAPIPDKHDWRASWHKQGKPDWLGTTPTKADGKFQHTASITGYVEERTAGGGGGYGVILFDNYGRPKVASVGVSPVRHVPLVYYELQGVRSALQLAFDNGFGPDILLRCNSHQVERILELCHDSMSFEPCSDVPVCACCVGMDIYKEVDDYDLLFPVIKEIVELIAKVKCRGVLLVSDCSASGQLAKCFSKAPAEAEESLFRPMDAELRFYEMVMRPDKFPDEVEDAMYDEVFRGRRIHSCGIKLDLSMHPGNLYRKFFAAGFAAGRDVTKDA